MNMQPGPSLGMWLIRAAEDVLTEVHDAMREPFPWGKQIPADVGAFSGLHDYCDANEFLLAIPQRDIPWPEYSDLLSAVSCIVDRRLAAEAVELDTGDRCRCGRLIRFNGGHGGGHVVHIDDMSHACDPCEFCQTLAKVEEAIASGKRLWGDQIWRALDTRGFGPGLQEVIVARADAEGDATAYPGGSPQHIHLIAHGCGIYSIIDAGAECMHQG